MKVLQLCLKPPLPALDGGCIAMNNITQGLIAAGHSVKILTVYTHKHHFQPEKMPAEYVRDTGIEGVFVDTRLNMVDAFSNFMTADSYNISRFFSTDMDMRIAGLLRKEKFDVIHLESLFMTPYLPTLKRFSKAPVVLRSHNLEFGIWEKIATGTRNIAKRTYLKYLTNRLKEYEIEALGSVSGIAAISNEDRKRFKSLGIRKPMRTIPFGINVDDYKTTATPPEMALFHLGAMDWSPNLEGIIWFLEIIWPRVHEHHPSLRLYLAGRNMPADLKRLRSPNVSVLGEVADARKFMNSKSIMVVPLLSGGGIRVKIIEGLALGKAIISTSIGAEGIDCSQGKDILIADSPGEWLKAISKLVNNQALCTSLGENGRKLAASHFDNRKIILDLVDFYDELRKE